MATEEPLPNKSTYCNYNEHFKQYDETRLPVGLPQLRSIFSSCTVPLSRQLIFEGGCGTGSFLAALSGSVGSVTGVEASWTGVTTARKKIVNIPSARVELGDVTSLTLADESYDGYLASQLLHHLDNNDRSFPNVDQFLSEALRILRRDGSMAILTCSQEQLNVEDGVFWHYSYIPSAGNALRQRYIDVEELMERMRRTGFVNVKQTPLPRGLFAQRYYRDATIFLEEAFKKSDSVFALSSDEEVSRGEAMLREDLESGRAAEILAESIRKSDRIGETLIVSGSKPQN